MTRMSTKEWIERLEGVGSLPTIPLVAKRAARLADSEDATFFTIASVIEGDPPLSGNFLKVANSAYYGCRQTIGTVQNALTVLGLRETKNLLLSVSVAAAFPAIPGKPTFDRDKFWAHCRGTAVAARMLANQCKLRFDGEEFLAGLLHDVGKIVLDQYFHGEFVEVLDKSYREKIPLVEAEKILLGTTHPLIGRFLLEQWKFPEALVEAIAHHHNPHTALEHKPFVATVAAANLLVKLADFGFSGEAAPKNFREHPAWRTFIKHIPKARKIDMKTFLPELKEEARAFAQMVS